MTLFSVCFCVIILSAAQLFTIRYKESVKFANVYYGDLPEAIFNTAVYFKNSYEDEWITDPFAKKMILDVEFYVFRN